MLEFGCFLLQHPLEVFQLIGGVALHGLDPQIQFFYDLLQPLDLFQFLSVVFVVGVLHPSQL